MINFKKDSSITNKWGELFLPLYLAAVESHLLDETELYKSGTPRKKHRTEDQDRNNNIRPEKIAKLNENVLY